VEHIGIDVHKKESQLCILLETGERLECRIRTDRERFAQVLGGRTRARIVLEASTESEWVARCLEALGHDVIVADPNFAPMYATRSRRVKTDLRDARALAEACQLGAYRRAHRTSDGQRTVRAQLAVRDALVRTRTRYIALVRALLRSEGLRVPGLGSADSFPARVAALAVPAALAQDIAPVVTLLDQLTVAIRTADRGFAQHATADPIVQHLTTVPGVGPITAAAFRAAVDDVTRFRDAHQIAAYFGVVPRERSSGECHHRGRITKSGNGRVRWLLIEAAWRVRRSTTPDAAALRTWAARIAARRGHRIATVALARRLAGILFAVWRDDTVFAAAKLRRPTPAQAA
jgi:transposase